MNYSRCLRIIDPKLFFIVMMSIALGSLILILTWYANSLSLKSDVNSSRSHIITAFKTGDLVDSHPWRKGDTYIGPHQWNDCLIIFQALDRNADQRQLSVSPLSPQNLENPCLFLRKYIDDEIKYEKIGFYHRYIHGHTTLVRFFLPIMEINTVRSLYKSTLFIIIFLGIAISGYALTHDIFLDRNFFWFIVFLVFSRFYGIEAFGQSLSHGPSDIIILIYLLFLSIASIRGGMNKQTFIIGAAFFGAMTMIFEFLTGGIPLGVAIIIGSAPFVLAAGQNIIQATISSVASFCGAIIGCMVARLAIISYVFGSTPLYEIIHQTLFRTGLSNQSVNVGEKAAGLSEYLFGIFSGLESLATGARLLTAMCLGLSLIAGAWGLKTLKKGNAKDWHNGAQLALSNLPLFLWCLVFWQHTAQHARFIDRIFVWTIISGASLFAFALRSSFNATTKPLDSL